MWKLVTSRDLTRRVEIEGSSLDLNFQRSQLSIMSKDLQEAMSVLFSFVSFVDTILIRFLDNLSGIWHPSSTQRKII